MARWLCHCFPKSNSVEPHANYTKCTKDVSMCIPPPYTSANSGAHLEIVSVHNVLHGKYYLYNDRFIDKQALLGFQTVHGTIVSIEWGEKDEYRACSIDSTYTLDDFMKFFDSAHRISVCQGGGVFVQHTMRISIKSRVNVD